MALTKCRECGHDVSTSAATCPNCGAPDYLSEDGKELLRKERQREQLKAKIVQEKGETQKGVEKKKESRDIFFWCSVFLRL